MTTIRVIDPWTEPWDIVFDDAGTPMLSFGSYPGQRQPGWILWTLEDSDSYFIPGNLLEVDQAIASAEQWLAIKERHQED